MAKRTKSETEAQDIAQTEVKKQKKEKKKDKAEKKQKSDENAQPAPTTFSLFGGKSNSDLDDVFSKGVSNNDRGYLIPLMYRLLSPLPLRLTPSLVHLKSFPPLRLNPPLLRRLPLDRRRKLEENRKLPRKRQGWKFQLLMKRMRRKW